VSEYLYKSLLV